MIRLPRQRGLSVPKVAVPAGGCENFGFHFPTGSRFDLSVTVNAFECDNLADNSGELWREDDNEFLCPDNV